MAPEQVAGDPNADHRADIYSLGCVAFEMLTGRTPFAGKTPQQTLAAHVVETPPSVTELRPDVPPALAALIAQCLEKEPARRPQSAGELARALEETTATGSHGRRATAVQEVIRGCGARRRGRGGRGVERRLRPATPRARDRVALARRRAVRRARSAARAMEGRHGRRTVAKSRRRGNDSIDLAECGDQEMGRARRSRVRGRFRKTRRRADRRVRSASVGGPRLGQRESVDRRHRPRRAARWRSKSATRSRAWIA